MIHNITSSIISVTRQCSLASILRAYYSNSSLFLPQFRPSCWSKRSTCQLYTYETLYTHSTCSTHRRFCSKIVDERKMADERDDTKSPPMKNQKIFKVTDAKKLDQKQIASGKWISLNLITYQDPLGNKRTWEGVERTTKQKNGQSDAVIIIPTLKRMYKYDSIILVKQFRPPLGCCTLEFPAGLIDEGESLETTAMRELKEETGYTGEVKHSSPVTTLDAGTGNCTASIVTVEIDGDRKINKRPVQESEPNEFIEVLKVPVDDLMNVLNTQSKQGVIVDARVYSYAIAIAHASKPPLKEKPDLSSFDG